MAAWFAGAATPEVALFSASQVRKAANTRRVAPPSESPAAKPFAELQSWARKWPWLAFVLLPLLAVPVQFVLSMAAAGGVFTFSTRVLGMTAFHPGAIPRVVGVLQAYGLRIASMFTAGVACFLAARRGAPVIWPIVGIVLIALVGATTNASFEWSPAVPRGAMSGGIGFSFPDMGTAKSLRVMLTLLFVLAPFLGLRGRTNRENRASSP